VAGFCVNGVEPSGYATIELVNNVDARILVMKVDLTCGRREIAAI
jgi:hypothetical protein